MKKGKEEAAWMPREKWEALVRGEHCPLCAAVQSTLPADLHAFTVADLRVSRLKLPLNQYVPGYTVLICRQHVQEAHHLSPQDARLFWEDLRCSATVVEKVFQPLKLNLEMLGNTVPHLHVHIVPRYYGDPAPGRPIDPTGKTTLLSISEYKQRISRIRTALAEVGCLESGEGESQE